MFDIISLWLSIRSLYPSIFAKQTLSNVEVRENDTRDWPKERHEKINIFQQA